MHIKTTEYLSMVREKTGFSDYKIAKEFIKNKVHIICDKPLTANVEDAVALENLVIKNKIVVKTSIII